MAFTEFCCKTGGDNLNAGTRTGNSTEPGTSADLTYASGNWVAATGVFTPASGDPVADGVAAGDFASVYADGSTTTGFVGRVTARTATTITVSLTAKAGTAPTDGTGTRTLKIGGAWLGPNGTDGFPINLMDPALTNSSVNRPRVNYKNDQIYSMTANIAGNSASATQQSYVHQGYTSTYGDGGRATFDGGTSGASYILLTTPNSTIFFTDLIFQNNGATGSASLVDHSNSGNNRPVFIRCVFAHSRGHGFGGTSGASGVVFIECEAYDCNQSNTANLAGFRPTTTSFMLRCISHDNTGSNAQGFRLNTNVMCVGCIAESNGNIGFRISGQGIVLSNCDAYNNTGSGIATDSSSGAIFAVQIENCNLVKNGAWGIDANPSGNTATNITAYNCAFGAGTQANSSGTFNTGTGANASLEVGSINLANDVTPWVDPANGDFRINLMAAKNAGRGAFTQTAASYTGTVGFPDIGAAQARVFEIAPIYVAGLGG